CDPATGFRAETLPGYGLDELADPESTCVPGSPGGGQDMVWADGLVRVRDRRFLAEEQRPVVAQPAEIPVQLSGLDLEVLGRVLVRQGDRLLIGADHDHLTIPVPRFANDLARAERGDLALALVDDGLAERPRRGDEDRGRGGAVLGLAQEVAGDDAGVGAVVGDDEDLRRPRQQIDADGAEDLPFGFGHVLVAWPDDHGNRGQGL